MGTQRLPLDGAAMTTTIGSSSTSSEANAAPFSGAAAAVLETRTTTGDELKGYSSSPSTVVLMTSSSTASSHLGSPTSLASSHHQQNHSPSHHLYHHLQSESGLSSGKKPSTSSVLNHDNLKIKSVFVRRYLKHNPLINCLLPLSCICALVVIVYLLKDFPKHALTWIEQRQEANTWTLVCWFMALFVVVSFPVTVGYLVLLITSGYLFGFLRGLLVVVVGANCGVAVAHYVIKSLQNKLPVHKLIKNETGRAILRVIAGPRAFKVVLFCRLTPIPFGLQNTIFGVSSVSSRAYHPATLLGLLPAQTINVYLGSTLRSMRDVLNDHKTAFAGYAVFAVEVLVGVLLMVWVVQKARIELSNALLADIGAEEKLLTDRRNTGGPPPSSSSSGPNSGSPRRVFKKICRLTQNSCRRPLRHLLPVHNHMHYAKRNHKPSRTV